MSAKAHMATDTPLSDAMNLDDIAHKLKLYKKLEQIKKDVLAGTHTKLKVPEEVRLAVLRSQVPEPRADGSVFVNGIVSTRQYGAVDTEMPDFTASEHATAGIVSQHPSNGHSVYSTMPTGAIQHKDQPQQEHEKHLHTASPSLSALRKQAEVASAKVFREVEDEMDLHNIDYGKITNALDLPYIELATTFAKALEIVPPVSGIRSFATEPELASNVSMNTSSYYSSRASWTPEVVTALPKATYPTNVLLIPGMDASAPVSGSSVDPDDEDEEEYEPDASFMPPVNAPTGPKSLAVYSPALDDASDEEELYGNVAPPSALPGLNHLFATAPGPGVLPSHSSKPRPIYTVDTSSDDIEEEYEPPAADAFDATDVELMNAFGSNNLAPTKRTPKGPKSLQAVEKGRNKVKKAAPEPALTKKQQRRIERRAEKEKMKHQKVPEPMSKRTRSNHDQHAPAQSSKRRKTDNIAVPSQLPPLYVSGSAQGSRSAGGVFIKQEPQSPLLPEMIPLPATPPSVPDNRRRSGYVSDMNGYGNTRSAGRGRQHRAQPSMDGASLAQLMNKHPPTGPRNMAVPATPPPPPPRDALRVIAIGSHTGKPYYNRPLRPGDVIPIPDASVPEVDDTPKTASAAERAATAQPETRAPLPAMRSEYDDPRDLRLAAYRPTAEPRAYDPRPYPDIEYERRYAPARYDETYELVPTRRYRPSEVPPSAYVASPYRERAIYLPERREAADDYEHQRARPLHPEDLEQGRYYDRPAMPPPPPRASLLSKTLRQEHERRGPPAPEYEYDPRYVRPERAASFFAPPPPPILAPQSGSMMPPPALQRPREEDFGRPREMVPPVPRAQSVMPAAAPSYGPYRSEQSARYGSMAPPPARDEHERYSRIEAYASPYDRPRTIAPPPPVPAPYDPYRHETAALREAYPAPSRPLYDVPSLRDRNPYVDSPYGHDQRDMIPPSPMPPPNLYGARAGTAAPAPLPLPPPPPPAALYEYYRATSVAPAGQRGYDPSARY